MENLKQRGLVLCLLLALSLAPAGGGQASARDTQPPAQTHPDACIAGPHKGTIVTSEEWCLADSPHQLTGTVVVANGATLTIEPGVVIQGCDACGILVYGDLVAVGTGAAPILFTSAADSGPGEWAGLRFNGYLSDGDGLLEYVTVRYGGDPIQGIQANVSAYYDNTQVTIAHSQILSATQGAATYGIHSANAHLVISDTVIAGSGEYGLYQSRGSLVLAGSTIAHSEGYAARVDPVSAGSVTGSTFAGNGADRLLVAGGNVVTHTTWHAGNEMAAYELEANVVVDDDVTLTVEPGVTVMGRDGTGMLVYGTMAAAGTEEQPILFTSTADSGPGEWAGLRFNGYGANGDGRLEYVTVRYGGDPIQGVSANISASDEKSQLTIAHSTIVSEAVDGPDCGLSIVGAQVILSDTVVAGSQERGVCLSAKSAALRMSGGAIRDNGSDGLYIPSRIVSLAISGTQVVGNSGDGIDYNGPPRAQVHFSQIAGNGGLGVRNRNTSVCLDAAHNYWGDDAGPNDPDAAGDGCLGAVTNTSAGAGVSQDVDYYPWLDGAGDVVPLLATSKAAADLNGGELYPGDIVHYTVLVTNTSPITVTGVVLTDAVPAHTTYVWDSDAPEAGVESAGLLAWQDLVLPTGVYSFTFDVSVGAAAVGQVISNTACLLEPGVPLHCTAPAVPDGGGLVQPVPRVYLPLVVRGYGWLPAGNH